MEMIRHKTVGVNSEIACGGRLLQYAQGRMGEFPVFKFVTAFGATKRHEICGCSNVVSFGKTNIFVTEHCLDTV